MRRKVCASQIGVVSKLASKLEQFLGWKWLFHQLAHHLGFAELALRKLQQYTAESHCVRDPFGGTQGRKQSARVLYNHSISPFPFFFNPIRKLLSCIREGGGGRV